MNSSSLSGFEYSERRIINNRRRRNKQLKQRLLISAFVISLFVILLFFLMSTKSMADNKEPLFKYYKSIQVQPGDTLYDLSQEYVNPEMNDVDSFIDEVRYINNLEEDSCLYEGNYIVVPYYATFAG
jgi:hypothetical protein